MSTLIVPDPHEKFVTVQKILEEYKGKVSQFVFLGDWFDDWRSMPMGVEGTARTLATVAERPDCTLLWGNHDVQYALKNPRLRCSGYDASKHAIIDKFVTPEHWAKFKFSTIVEGAGTSWLVSHAGLHQSVFPSTVCSELTSIQDWLDEEASHVMKTCNVGRLPAPFAVGWARGGRDAFGGPLWLDWNQEFDPIEGIHQIVGHTPGDGVRTKIAKDSVNFCLDTNLNNVALVTDRGIEFRRVG